MRLAASLILVLGCSPLFARAQVVQPMRRVPSQLSAFYSPSAGGGASLKTPAAMAVGPSGSVYVFDSGNSRVIKLTPGGQQVPNFGGGGSVRVESGGLNDAIAVDRQENVYVTNATAGPKILKFDSGGNLLGGFRVPAAVNAIAVNSRGEILVALIVSRPMALVHVFSPEGKFLRGFGHRLVREQGRLPQDVNQIKLAVDSQDNVFVAFRAWPVVRKYAPDGTLLSENSYPVPQNLLKPDAVPYYSLDFIAKNPGANFTLPLLVLAVSVNRERGCYVLLNGSGIVKVSERGEVVKQNVFLAPQGNNVTFIHMSMDARSNRVLLLDMTSGIFSMPLVKNRAVL